MAKVIKASSIKTKEERKDPFEEIDKVIIKEFEDMVDMSKVDTKVSTWYDSGVYAFNYACSKNLYGAYPKGRVIGIEGLSGTGKSLMASVAMRDPKVDYVIIVEAEGGGNADELISFAGVDKRKVRKMWAATFSSYKVDKKNGNIEEVKDTELPKNKDTDKFIYVEGLTSKIRRLIHSLQFNKIKKNILIILDSLGNIQSVRALAGGFDMGKRGQDFTNFFKNFDNAFEKSGLTFIFTNKMYQNMDISTAKWNPYISTGGESPIYNSSLYITLSTTSITDDVSAKEMTSEKEQRKTALGSSLKTVKMRVRKSRFGTEMRNIPFLLDFSVGPVRMSGLFTLCYDFGVIQKKSGAYYEMPGIFSKAFYKKDFIKMVLEDEEKIIAKIQKKLEEAEVKIKKEKQSIQINDLEDMDDTIIAESNGKMSEDSKDEMIKAMAKEIEE